jgi:Fe-S-cluster containining protein
MGIFSSAYLVLKNEISNQIPKVSCLACGECCVTPYVTLIEFCYMMDFLSENPDQLIETISKVVPYHPDYPGYFKCRFQTADNFCGIYPNRPLACRMHGHPVLEKMGMQYHVYCLKIQSVERDMPQEEVYAFLDKTNNLNQGYYPYYTAPYWVSGLNIETWMTILFTDVNRSFFKLLQKIIKRNLQVSEMAPHFIQKVNLKEKVELIEEFQSEFSSGQFEKLEPLLYRIQNDFPDTGAYYYFESDLYRNTFLEKRA